MKLMTKAKIIIAKIIINGPYFFLTIYRKLYILDILPYIKIQHKEIKKLLNTNFPIIVEIGAHEGGDSTKFLNQFKNLQLFCFEPDDRCIKVFKDNITDSRCILVEKAVGNKTGKVTFYPSTGSPEEDGTRKDFNASSSIKKPTNNPKSYPWLHFKEGVEKDIIRLDDFVLENAIEHIDFMWIDVQGAERDLIEGGRRALNLTKFLKIEYGETETYSSAMTRKETIERLNELNFKVLEEYSSKNAVGDLVFKKIL